MGKTVKGNGGDGVIADDVPGGQGKLAASGQSHLGLIKLFQPDLRAFGVQQQSNRKIQLFPQGFYLVGTDFLFFVGLMGKVQADHVNAGLHQFSQNISFVGCRAKSADDFGLSHNISQLHSEKFIET